MARKLVAGAAQLGFGPFDAQALQQLCAGLRGKVLELKAPERTALVLGQVGHPQARGDDAQALVKGGQLAQKRLRLSKAMAEQFYAVHAERPFFRDLVTFMISGPVVVQVLEGENAVQLNRDIMGATNPANAAPGTIRKDFAESIEANSVHGSDSLDNARGEIAFFFAAVEICP